MHKLKQEQFKTMYLTFEKFVTNKIFKRAYQIAFMLLKILNLFKTTPTQCEIVKLICR